MNQVEMLSWLVPVLPAATRPPASGYFFAVPSVRTLLIAYATAVAMRGSRTWRQSAVGTASALPFLSSTLVIAIGSQNVPLEAKVAKAAAMVIGATSLMPRIMDGTIVIGWPSARWKPRLFATSVISHRSSWFPMSTYAVLTELAVALSTVMKPEPTPSTLLGLHGFPRSLNGCAPRHLSLIHISEPTRRTPIS